MGDAKPDKPGHGEQREASTLQTEMKALGREVSRRNQKEKAGPGKLEKERTWAGGRAMA